MKANNSFQYTTLLLFLMFNALASYAQENVITNDTIKVFEEDLVLNVPEEKFPRFKLGGVFQGRYLANFKKDVDINGLQHSNGEGTSNSFEVKRMRVSLTAQITQRLELVTLVNLADFKNDNVSKKVLENAYARYTVNRYFQLTLGQFRPMFGLEETFPVDVVKSIDYSNSYYLFGSNGWTSFQIGVAGTGSTDLGGVEMSYGVSITNGNGKNTTANDDGKHYSSRLLFNLDKKHNINIGMSGGIAEVKKKKAYAAGLEATMKFKLSDRWSIDFQTEAKQATNYIAYFEIPQDQQTNKLSDYLIKSFYILPNIRYEIGKPHLQALEFSFRYEYLDADSKLDSNPRNTFIPMLSLELLKNYAARIQIGMQIDNFKHNISDTKTYNSNLAFVQFQCRL